MANQRTETVHSEYGEVEVEVVDCDSCNNTVAKEDTVPFTIGDRDGLACRHCEREGPVSFPRKVLDWGLHRLGTDPDGDPIIAAFFAPWLYFLLGLFGLLGEEDLEFYNGFGWATITYFSWAVIFILIWVELY